LNFFAKRRMKAMLKHCDYVLAAEVIHRTFLGKEEYAGFSSHPIEAFLKRPCRKTALSLVESDPLFAYYFTESSPGGLYYRMNRKTEAAPLSEADSLTATAETAAGHLPGLDRTSGMTGTPAEKPPSESSGMPEGKRTSGESAVPSRSSAAEPERPAAEKRPGPRFPNVIQTLQQDLDALQSQVTWYERQIMREGRFLPSEERSRIQAQLQLYKEGTREFRDALELLRAQSAGRSRK